MGEKGQFYNEMVASGSLLAEVMNAFHRISHLIKKIYSPFFFWVPTEK